MPDVPSIESAILFEGPWTHRTVRANGIAMHIAEVGAGPLVLFLHGFPQFWWTWRDQLGELADAGFRAVAVDLRGIGASDKPPRGYDTPTLANDVAALVAALGERDAMLVGNDLGGLIAWTVAAQHPRVARRLAVVGAAHPLRLRQAVATEPRTQGSASAYAWRTFQVPRRPEALLTRDAAYVGELFERWSGPKWRDTPSFVEDVDVYARALRVPKVAHTSLEQFRWLVRSQARPDGRRFAARLREPITAPVLQLHGADDRCVLPATAQGSGRYVSAEYEWRLIDGVGHYPQNETPDVVSGQLIRWAKQG